MKNILFLSICLSMLGGCATNYSCGQFPTSGCQPVSTVYERTNDGFNDYRKTLYDEDNGNKAGHKKGKHKSNRKGRGHSESSHVHVGQAHRTLNYAAPGDPILTKPVTLRILFNSWVDKEQDLNAGGFVYIRLRDSQWLIN